MGIALVPAEHRRAGARRHHRLHRRQHDARQPPGARRRARLRRADHRVRGRIRVHAGRSARGARRRSRPASPTSLLQTPVPFFGFQPYFTVGGGFYQEELGTAQRHGLRAEHRRRREDDAGRADSAPRRLSSLQAGKRCAVFTSAPHLRRTESEVLRPSEQSSVSVLIGHQSQSGLRLTTDQGLLRSETSDRLTKFWPDAYDSAYFLYRSLTSAAGTLPRGSFDTV